MVTKKTSKTSSKTTTTEKQAPKRYYFARAGNQAAVLWNPKKEAPWAEFDRWGLFTTKDVVTAQAVLDAGYRQVSLKEIKARNLPTPEDGSPTANYQPGAPGKGYQQPKQPQAEPAELQDEDDIGPVSFVDDDDDFPTGPDLDQPDGNKRTLR